MQYRRVYQNNGCYFFTLVTANRQKIFNNPDAIMILRSAFKEVKRKYPFSLDAVVVLPDHIHCIWKMPETDIDYSLRWRLIKTQFTKCFLAPGKVWQNRFWEHLIKNEKDYHHHVDYIHYNPVKHGYVGRVGDWPYSSFAKFVRLGWYAADWGSNVDIPESIGRE